MRNRGLIDCIQLCELFFLRLLQCQDRLLRVTIQTHIINDIKKQNEKHKNHKLNSVCFSFLLNRKEILVGFLDIAKFHVYNHQRK